MNEHILTGLALLIALGAGAQWLAWRLRIPSILVLLIVGFVAGPVTGLLDPDALLGPLTFPLVSLGAAIVLLEGGLTVSWRDLRRVVKPVRRLITMGLLVTWGGVTCAAYYFLNLKLEIAALLGAILVVTGPTVIGPLLRHARPHGQVGRILKFEGILNDPLGAVLAVLVFQVIEAERVETALSLVVLGVAKAAVLASGIGVIAAWLYTTLRQRDWLPATLENAVLLPLALGVYALANVVQHESGLLAVTVLGIALASQTRINIEASLKFTEQARTMLIPLLFVLLTARMELSDLTGLPLGALAFVAIVIFAIRPISVLLSTMGTDLSWRERVFLGAMAPRGIVAAAVSSVFALRLVDAGHERATLLMPIAFVVIAVSVAIYGLSARTLVRVLKLEQPAAHGVLMLGASHTARTIALCLHELGLRVLLVDADHSKVVKAQLLGLEAEHGRLLSDHVLNRIDLDDIGHFVAVTSDDDTNTLAAAHFRDVFGWDNVHQLQASGKSYAKELRGQLFAQGKTYDELAKLVHRGAVGKITQLTETFSFDDYKDKHGPKATPLFALSPSGSLRTLYDGADKPSGDERVVSLGLASDPFDSDRTAADPDR